MLTPVNASQSVNKTAIYMCSLHVKKERYSYLCLQRKPKETKVTICAKTVIKSWHGKFLPHQENARSSLTTLRSWRLSLKFTAFLRDVSWSSLHISAGQEEAEVKKKKAVKIPHTSPPATWKHFWEIHFAVVWT